MFANSLFVLHFRPGCRRLQQRSVTRTNKDVLSSARWQPAPDIVYEVMVCTWGPCHRKGTTWKIYECRARCSEPLRDQRELRQLGSRPRETQINTFCWQKKQRLLTCIARRWTLNRPRHDCTPMADSSQDSHGDLERVYTPDTSVLHAPTHTVGSEMTRGYTVGHFFPLTGLGLRALTAIKTWGLLRKQGPRTSPGPETQQRPRVFPSRSALSKLKTPWREDGFSDRL